jgi:hypothetical protein
MTTAVSGTLGLLPPALGRTRCLCACCWRDALTTVRWTEPGGPRTHPPATELTAPVAGFASRGVVVSGLSLSVTGWDSAPGRIRLDDRDVRLIWFAYRAPSSWGTAPTRSPCW